MYSYFVLWRDSDYNLRRLNICLSKPQMELDGSEIVTAVKKRCAELKVPFDLGDDEKFRIFPDPAHGDTVLWPGRSSYQPT